MKKMQLKVTALGQSAPPVKEAPRVNVYIPR